MSRFPAVYSTENGRSEVDQFLRGLPVDAMAMCRAKMRALAEGEMELERPHVAFVEDGIWELRVRWHQSQYRFLFGLLGRHKYIMLVPWQKDQSAIPRSSIELAKRRHSEWQRRNPS